MRRFSQLFVVLVILLSGSVLVPYAAFSSERFGWQLFAGISAPEIRSVRSGDWNDPATWDLKRVPNSSDVVRIRTGHTVVGPASDIYALHNFGVLKSRNNQPLEIRAAGAIYNYGQILGNDGSLGTGYTCGGQGSSIRLWGRPIHNEGTIQAGHGGDGDQCGGAGGSTMVLGQNTTNGGTICAGRGGDVLGTASGWAGNGGHTHIWGKYRQYGGTLINTSRACGGDGGDGNPNATGSQVGGSGGLLKLISLPYVYLNGGEHYAGRGGRGTGDGADGRDGGVFIEPSTISLAGSDTRISGGDVTIFGGDDWTLDLSNMSNAAISAAGSITLAVGNGGVIDLGGNTSQVLQASDQVIIASDGILLDPGVDLTVVAGTNVLTGPSQILYDVSLVGPGQATTEPGVTLPINLTILNGGPLSDTYSLNWSDSASWSLGTLPSPITVGGLDQSDLTLNVTPPSTASSGDTDVITVTATSSADPNLVVVEEVKVYVETATKVYYLPLILKNYP